jgi:hypothetical protein
LFREYPTHLFGLATGQSFNLFMSVLGAGLIAWFSRKRKANADKEASVTVTLPLSSAGSRRLWLKRALLILLLLFSLTMPSDWTQDIPARYGKRHAGLHYSLLYPRIAPATPVSDANPESRTK